MTSFAIDIFAFSDLQSTFPLKKTAEGGRKFSFNLFRCFKPHFLELQL